MVVVGFPEQKNVFLSQQKVSTTTEVYGVQPKVYGH
jgi:hypothetical protein